MTNQKKVAQPTFGTDMFITKAKTGMFNVRNVQGKFTKQIKIYDREYLKNDGKTKR